MLTVLDGDVAKARGKKEKKPVLRLARTVGSCVAARGWTSLNHFEWATNSDGA